MSKFYRSSYKNPWILVTMLLAGGIVGSALGKTLIPLLPSLKFLGETGFLGFNPVTLNLGFISFTLGFSLVLGPLTALGIIIGYLLYRKL